MEVVRSKTQSDFVVGGDLGLVGVSRAIEDVRNKVRKFAQVTGSVVIEGESGTGKELAARAIHASSERASKPFVTFDCGEVSASLMGNELFGHVRGAFTGADRDRPGVFEIADNGTLFFDEIGELPLELQPKLLRALEAREIRRIGASVWKSVNVRFIAATNRNLAREVSLGRFRADLLFRLNVLQIHIPPLRDRIEDLGPLSRHFFEASEKEMRGKRLDEVAFDRLRTYSWPGNVRELKNVLYRAALDARSEVIMESDLDLGLVPFSVSLPPLARALPRGERDEDEKKAEIEEVLRQCGGNQTAAAKVMKCHRNTIANRIRRFRLKTDFEVR